MELHIILRPKNHPEERSVQRAGTIQFNKWFGTELRAKGTATLWWKEKYIHCRVNQSTSVVHLEILPTAISRLLHFGFTIDILRNNTPIFFGEWQRNVKLNSGFTVQINLEEILQGNNNNPTHPLVSVYTRQPAVHPVKSEVYTQNSTASTSPRDT